MPQLGRSSKKKEAKKEISSSSSKEVVSAYSEEGQRRIQKSMKPISSGFKIWLLIGWTLCFIVAFIILMGPSFGWW